MKTEKFNMSLIEAFCIILFLICCLGVCIIGWQMPPHVPILLVFSLLCFFGHLKGLSWDDVFDGIVKGISPGIIPLIIFLLIGVLVSSLIAAGTIPAIVVYGCDMLSASHFLVLSFLLTVLVGITVGSSFTTISTVGIVIMTIGGVLGLNGALVAGAIVSGAFLANNLSPLSDTANLASAIGDIDLVRHLRNVFKSALPAGVITVIIYAVMDMQGHVAKSASLTNMAEALQHAFVISPVTLLPVIIILICSLRRMPAIPTLLLGIISSLVVYGVYNPTSEKLFLIPGFIMNGYVSNVGIPSVDKLLSRGGILSMMPAASMIILALSMGGLLVKLQVISTLVNCLSRVVNSAFRLVLSTALGSILINVAVGEQYLSIVLPGETFKPLYRKMGLPMSTLTRTLADGGAAFTALVPWGVSGTFIVGTLGLHDASYVLYSFYPILAPVMTVIIGSLTGRLGKEI